MPRLPVAIGVAIAILVPTLTRSSEGGPVGHVKNGELVGAFTTVRWTVQTVHHRSFPDRVAILLENSSANAVLAQLYWRPLVCDGTEIPLDPFVEPPLADLVNARPSYLLQPGSWQVALFPLGIPVRSGHMPEGRVNCAAHFLFLFSAPNEGEEVERSEFSVPIPHPTEGARPD